MVDRGGLEYKVAVEDAFSSTLRDFRAEIDKSSTAWREYKNELEGVASSARALKEAAKGLSKAASITVRETQAGARANQEAASAADIRSKAEKKLAKDIERSRVAIEARRVADERGANVYRRLAKDATIRQQAEAELDRTIQRRAKDQILAQLAEERGVSLQKRANRELTVRQEAERRLERVLRQRAVQEQVAAIAAERGIELSQRRATVFDAEALALERIRKAEQKRSVTEALRSRGFDSRGNPLEKQLSLQERAAKRVQDRVSSLSEELEFRKLAAGNQRLRELNRELALTEGRANRISFTFRRLFGILAAFAAARLALQGIREAITESVRFNASIEQSRLGIASLFTAVGDVRDAFGQTTNSARGLELAQRAAADQTKKLRLEALQTAATFDEIVDAFQVAIAPGFGAGLDIGQIRKFSVQVSQAAGALGVAQNQLSEEIRSILGGTIQLRTTRIAAALGITNEDIRRAKDLGILYDFLQDRFQAFTVAGQESLQTFNAILTNTKDSLLLLVSDAGFGFFEELKGLLNDIRESVTTISENGIELDPDALALVEALFDGLRGAVAEARRLKSEISFGELLGAAKAVGGAIELSAKLVGTIVEGFVRGLSTAQSIAQSITAQFQSNRGRLADLLPVDDLREAGVVTTQFLTVLAGAAVVLKSVALLASATLIPFRALVGVTKFLKGGVIDILSILKKVRLVVFSIPAPFLLIGVAAFALLSVLGEIFEKTTGISLKFETIVKIVKVSLAGAFKAAAATAKVAFLATYNFLKSGFRGVIFAVKDLVLDFTDAVLFVLDKLGVGVEDARKKVQRLQREGRKSFLEETVKDSEAIRRAALEAEQAYKEAGREIKEGVSQALNENDQARTAKEFFANLKKQAGEKLDGIFNFDTQGVEDQLAPLSQAFEELPGIIGQSADRLNDTSATLAEMTETIKDLRTEYEGVVRVANLTGAAAKAARIETEAEIAKRKQLLEVNTRILNAQQASAAAISEQAVFERRLLQLSDNELFLVVEGERLLRSQADLSRQLSEEQNKEAITRLALNKLKKEGATLEASAKEEALRASRERIAAIEEEIRKSKLLADDLLTGLDPKVAKEVQEIILGLISAQGKLKAAQDDALALGEKRAEVEDRIREIVEKRVALVAAEELPALKRANEEARARLEFEKSIGDLRKDSLFIAKDDFEVQAAEISAQIQLERALLQSKQQQRQLDIQSLNSRIAQTKDTETRIQLEGVLNGLKEQGAIEDALALERMDQALAKTEELQAALKTPISSGILLGLKQFAEEYGTQTALITKTAELTKKAFLDLSDTISSALIDALDPSKEVDVAQRLLTFVRDLANEIIKEFVRIAIARAVLGVIGSAGGGAASAGSAAGSAAAGAAKGGPVPTWGAPSAAHFAPGVQGLSDGGMVTGPTAAHRPPGLDPRDRVPVWMRPKEWAVVPEAVRAYGARFLSALNARAIDPGLTDMLLAKSRYSRVQRGPKAPGFAEGGPLTSETARIASAEAGGERGPSIAIIPPDNQNMDRLLSSGKSAMLSFIENNSSTISKLLDGGKGGKRQ